MLDAVVGSQTAENLECLDRLGIRCTHFDRTRPVFMFRPEAAAALKDWLSGNGMNWETLSQKNGDSDVLACRVKSSQQ